MINHNIEYNYNLLQKRIKEKGYTQTSLAKKMNMGRTSINMKLNNRAYFSQSEIVSMIDLLEINADEIGTYFFSQFVQKTV